MNLCLELTKRFPHISTSPGAFSYCIRINKQSDLRQRYLSINPGPSGGASGKVLFKHNLDEIKDFLLNSGFQWSSKRILCDFMARHFSDVSPSSGNFKHLLGGCCPDSDIRVFYNNINVTYSKVAPFTVDHSNHSRKRKFSQSSQG